MKRRLIDHASDRFSQFGEDGMIAAAFAILGEGERRCIEFGAWDGYHLSNTANLWTAGWSAILIEADASRFRTLVERTAGHPCRCIQRFVGIEPGETLEDILRDHGLPPEADFLSIDTDGDDYYIFRSLERLRPRLVCCEYNPTIPAHLDLVPRPGARFGCSPLSLSRLAEAKGYRLIGLTEGNLFFVREEDFPRFSEYETSLEALAENRHLTYLINGFDGSYLLSQRPTYGFRRPTQHPFDGPCFHVASTPDARPRPFHRRLIRALRSRLRPRRAHSPSIAPDPEVLAAWHRDRGDQTLRLDYPLDPGSVVLDVGGFRGQWASDIFARFACEVHIFEPVEPFAAAIRRRFAGNPRLRVHGFGLAAETGTRRFSVNGDSSSALRRSDDEIEVAVRDIASWLSEQGIDEVHLIKINAEGIEFELIERLIDSGSIHRIRDLQVQFHPFVERAAERRRDLQGRLALTHRLSYEYPFVWESWRRRDAEPA